MGLRMKNILGVHWKIWLLGEGGGVGGFTKNQYRRRDCLKRGVWIVCIFKGGLVKKRGWCVWGGCWCPNAHYVSLFKLICFFTSFSLLFSQIQKNMILLFYFCIDMSHSTLCFTFSFVFYRIISSSFSTAYIVAMASDLFIQ